MVFKPRPDGRLQVCVCVCVRACGWLGISGKEGKQTSVCFSEEQSTQVANGYAA